MNESLKNVCSFIKEALELKNKNVYTVKDYEIHFDFGSFYSQFKELIEIPDYASLNINSEGIIFKIKYIKDEYKKEIPSIPNSLESYISLKNGNDIISIIDNLEIKLEEEGLIEEYRNFDGKIKEINRYNNLIDLYNSKYLQFYNVYKRINDYEEKIEIIFGKRLLMWQNNQNDKLERYILEANLEIYVDPVNNIITFEINKEKFRGFVTDFLNIDAYKVKDINLLNEFVKNFNSNIDVNNEFDLSEEVVKYINYISLENEIVDRELQNNEELKILKTYLFNNSGIIVRNKNVKLWIEDLEKIIGLCDTTNFINPILNMFEVDFSEENQVYDLLNDKSYEDTKDDEVLFPLPSNDEQYKIVDKVKSSNVVLVQGPPGTGKSHTIANLLSHYISEGKKVIVTSEKAKALEVLREKLPQNIRSLSLSLLTSNGVDKDLELSIENVLKHQVDDNELLKIKESIDSLSEKLKTNHQKKQEIIRNIIELMSKDTISHKEELNEIINYESSNELTLMDMAIWLDKNKDYKLVPINDIENYTYVNPKEFFDKLDDICDDIKNNCFAISSNIPINDYLKSNDIELYIKECIGFKNYQIHNTELISAIKQSDLKEEIINELNDKMNDLSVLYQFFEKEWIKSNISYEVFINKIQEIYNLIENNKEFFMSIEEILYDYNINFDDNNKKYDYKDIINEILKLYDDKGVIHLFDKIKFNSYIKNLNGLSYNGKSIEKGNIKQDDLIKIRDVIDYYVLTELIKSKIMQVLNIDLFEKYNIPKNQFGKYEDKIIDILKALLNYKIFSKEIDNCFKKLINTNLFTISYLESSEEYINNIFEDLKYYITENSTVNKSNRLINEIRDYYEEYNLQNLDRVLISIETNQLDEYIQNKNLLLHEINVVNQYNNLKKIYDNLVREKQNLVRKYIYDYSLEEKQFLKANIDKIFKYHYIEKYYLSLESKELALPELYSKRENLIKEEKSIIANLVEKKGWYYQSKNMTYNISTSLNKWVNLKRKLGGGTGKNTNLYLAQMREEMSTAKNAIPVWIMPIDKLIEQYPFVNNPPFDVLIMDESSQSSVFSISALSRAKKVIIVGDDKQISPTNAFTSIEAMNDLRAKYLKNNNWDLQISRDTSIYDIIQTICGNKKITLTEHFRCLPEIINYSNKEYYNMEINPLKVRGNENTIEKPIKTIYVHNATCQKISNQIYNQAEIDRILLLIGEIANDKQYDNKSIGIIALLKGSSRYIQKLTELIMQKFGEDFINSRKIKVGNTPDFQGDERDVIILGMVISSITEAGEKYSFRSLTTQEDDKSFNVAASRAKEQMILVHSVTLDELSSKCNRYRLLNYCLNYDSEKEQEYEKLFESTFEKDVYNYLTFKNYKLEPQFKVGNYRIDFVLTNDNNQKIAIECDGDIYHGINELEHDLERQSILERCGWKFARIRASEFYYNKEESIRKLIDTINNYLNGNNSINYSIFNNYIPKNEIVFNKYSNSEVEINFENKDNIINNEIINEIFELGPSQFRYMVLYSEGISRKEISDYYKVDYDTVKKSLQKLSKKYGADNIDGCISNFKEKYYCTDEYKKIIDSYKKQVNKSIQSEQFVDDIFGLFDDTQKSNIDDY